MLNIITLFASLALTYCAAAIGAFFTIGAFNTWYPALIKPGLNPPGWLFGPVWTVLYAFMAIAAWRVYGKLKENPPASRDLKIYAGHLAVNAFWSVAFFGLRSPELSLAVIAALWILIVYLFMRFYRTDRIAGYLFLPYLAWVSFASYLNLMIVILN